MNSLCHTLRRVATLGLALGVCSGIQAQIQAEYFIDDDPGFGHAITVTDGFADDGTLQFQPSVADLPAGNHVLGIRAYSTSTDGEVRFGPTIVRMFTVPRSQRETPVEYLEYFWDDDPGFGHAITVTDGFADDGTLQFQPSVADLPVGNHVLGIRAYRTSTDGVVRFGPTIVRMFTVPRSQREMPVEYLEYFWDDDPGYGQATSIALTPATELRMDDIEIPADKDSSTDLLFVRAFGGEGWGPTVTCSVEELFAIAEADLAALRKFYADYGGSTWSGRQWDTATENTASISWSGVDFDSEGHVTAIELPDRNISGTLTAATTLSLPRLASLNLSGNLLQGDVSMLANGERLPLLAALDLSYNQIDELSELLPTTITTLNLSNQHRARNNNKVFPDLADQTAIGLNVGNEMTVGLPAILGYNHTRQSLDVHPQLTVYDQNLNTKAWLSWSPALGAYTFSPSGMPMKEAQDAEVIIVPTTTSGENYSNAYNSAYRAQLQFTEGDANLSGWVDVNDVQRTLNYVLQNNYNSSAFGLWAANTYDDDDYNADNETINIQDIVCTVNVVLENEGNPRSMPRRLKAAGQETANLVYADGRTLMLDATDEVAAFSLHLRGAKSNQVKLLLNSRQWQMQARDTDDGVSLLVFSPAGSTLPTGISQLLRWAAEGEPTSMQATGIDATDLPVTLHDGTATGVEIAEPASELKESEGVYDLQGRRVKALNSKTSTLNSPLPKGIYIMNGKKIIR